MSDEAKHYFHHIILGTNITTICNICGACVADWWRIGNVPTGEYTDDGYLRPNQIKHLQWHRQLDELA